LLRFSLVQPSPTRTDHSANGASDAAGMFTSLADRDFRLMWLGNLAATFAMQMQIIGRGWLIYDMTGSAVSLAWVTLSFAAPMVLFSMFGGVAADRLTKKWLLAGAQLLNFLVTALLAALVLSGAVTFWHFMVFGAINGTILAISMPARQSMVPEIVGEQRLVNAVALNSASMNLSRILGPTTAGGIIALVAAGDTGSSFGVGVVFAMNALLYLLSVVSLLLLRHEGRSTRTHPSTIRGDMADTFRYIADHRLLRGLVLLTFIPPLFGMPIQALMPVFNDEVLGGGPGDLGLLLSAMGGGAIVGSLILARLGDGGRKGLALLVLAVAWSVFLALFALTSRMSVALGLIAVVGLASSTFMSLNMSLVQLAVTPDMRGRVMSVIMMSFGLMPLGAVPISFIADLLGISAALVASAAALLVTTVVVAVVIPEVRSIDRHVSPPPRPVPLSAEELD
jgi:MFS family permease